MAIILLRHPRCFHDVAIGIEVEIFIVLCGPGLILEKWELRRILSYKIISGNFYLLRPEPDCISVWK